MLLALLLGACTASAPEPSARLEPTPAATEEPVAAEPPACLDAKLVWADGLERLNNWRCISGC